MRTFSSLAAFGAILLAAGGAAAADKGDPAKPKKVCHVVEAAVGRLPAKRVCETIAPAPAAAQPQAGGEHGGSGHSASNPAPAPQGN
jgi:hypothetical protein